MLAEVFSGPGEDSRLTTKTLSLHSSVVTCFGNGSAGNISSGNGLFGRDPTDLDLIEATFSSSGISRLSCGSSSFGASERDLGLGGAGGSACDDGVASSFGEDGVSLRDLTILGDLANSCF